MRIKSIEISGFKSFVDKTVFTFKPGIAAIVGPNGCGKSNLVDAMRWAMGEQAPRRLRGKGMEDVIFAGSEARPPVGLAEVVLTFDNADGSAPAAFSNYSEIQVARRLYRSGESEYRLNKTECRLRDIHDFFRDTGIGTKGYTIVEQGRIAEIVSAKPEERRVLIEEAAGISKYKARRREAEGKISSTEQNLLRVTDVVGEIRRQIHSIERQARKASRYKRLRETLRVLDLSLAVDDRSDLTGEIDAAHKRCEALRGEAISFEARLAERELAIENKRIELGEREQVLNQGSERLFQLRSEIKELESRIAFGKRERETLADSNAARREELVALHEQLRHNQSEAQRVGDELAALEGAFESVGEALAAAEAEARDAAQKLRELERDRDAGNAGLVEVLTRIARSEDRLSVIEDRLAGIDQRQRNADEQFEVQQSEAARADREQRALEEGLRNLLAERDRLMGALRKSLETHQRAAARAREASAQLQTAREAREVRKARLSSLVEVLERREDLSEGNRFLLEQDAAVRRAHRIRALVRDVLVVDEELERAVEAVLGERAEALVVERAEGAFSAIEALREARAGHGLFVVEPRAEATELGFAPLGEPLLERVRVRAGYEGVARALLGGVNLVDRLEAVLEVYDRGRIPATFVTRQGDVISPDGVARGGRSGPSAGHLTRRREIREFGEEVGALEEQAARCEAEHRAAETELGRASDELDNLRNRHHTAALAVANHEKDLERTRERVKALGEMQEGRAAERSQVLTEAEALEGESEQLRRLLEELRGNRVACQSDLDALGLRIGSAGREVTRLETAATERRVEHAGRAERVERLREERGRSETALADTREWIARREGEIDLAEARGAEIATQIEEAERTLTERLGDEEAARLSHDERRDAYERVAAELRSVTDEARDLRAESSERRERAQQAEMEVREAELRLSHLDDAVREKWDVELASWQPPPLDPSVEPAALEPPDALDGADAAEDSADSEEGLAAEPDAAKEARANAELARLPREERRQRLEEARRRREALGEVTLAAIEEHEELRERFRFLSEQKADLDRTLESLREAIQRINRTSRRRFRETFEAVSERFSQNFPRLFQGGRASLSLTESEDVLEAGIEIMAMPPGKRLQNVNLLSGGEKTLTAIALLVAVFQVRPSPFFLLDEVDAALDDANVGRFNEIVTELAKDSQFLIITHNKRTIEVADVLYGVTMEQRGVSKLVSVELH